MKAITIPLLIILELFFFQLYAQGPLNSNPTADPTIICMGNVSQLNANASGGIGIYTYYWTSDPPGFTSEEANPIVSPTETTIYNVEVTDGNDFVIANVSVIVYNQLTAKASPDFQFCQNGQHNIKVQSTNSGNDFTTIWYFMGNPVGFDSIYSVTWSQYGQYAPNTITFICTITDECGNVDSDEVNCTFFPVVEITGVQQICLSATIQLVCSNAQFYEWHYGSISGPLLGNTQMLNYTPVTPGFHTICVLILNDCGEQADTCFTFEVTEAPVPNAGNDQSVYYGTSTILQGSGSSGSGNYSYHWEPSNYLINPDLQNPQTINLYQETTFSLNVTDVQTGCFNEFQDEVRVFLNGDPLDVIAEANFLEVCQGESVQLYGLASGGSGIYTYNWSSIPPGFTSNEANPIVTPVVTTTYTVLVNDGFNTADGSINILVSATPFIDLGPDITVCVTDTVLLSAGNPGMSYSWSTGSTAQYIIVTTSNTEYNVQTILVTVTSPYGCIATDSRVITFDVEACSGINDPITEKSFHVYPNPISDNSIIEYELKESGMVTLTIFNHLGQKVEILINEPQDYGEQKVTWKAEGLPSGIYFYRLTASSQSITGKIVVVK